MENFLVKAAPHDFAFLSHGGETGALIKAHDWSATPLGPLQTWPPSLRIVLALLLRSPTPIVMLWGEDGVMLYNDAYSVFAGGRHPALLGSKVREGWAEVADFNDHVMKTVLAGGTLTYRDQALILHRNGRAEQVWMNLDYSPVIDERGAPAGVIAIVVETSARVLAERRALFLNRLGERLRANSEPAAATTAAAEMLGLDLGCDRVGYGEIADEDGEPIVVVDRHWCAPGAPAIRGRHRLRDYAAPFIEEFDAGRAIVFENIERDPRTAGLPAETTQAGLGVGAQIVAPLVKEGRLSALLFVHSARPRQWRGEEISLVAEVAERIGAAVERARAGQALRQSEERMRLALVAGGFSDWYWDAAEDRVRFSPRAAENLGVKESFRPSSGDIAELVVDEDRAAVVAAGERAFASGEPYRIEYRARPPGGETMWIESYGQPVRGDTGRVTGIIGISQVITARKQAEEALKEREQQLSAFVSQTMAGFAQVDPGGRFTLVNDRFCEITGWSREALLKLRMQDITHQDDLPNNIELFERAVREGEPYNHEKRYVRPDGSIVWVNNSVAAIRSATGGLYGVLAVTLDVTERRRAEEALRRSEESVRLAVEGAGMATWEVDLTNMIGHWSGTRFDILGYERPPDGIGRTEDWLNLVHADDREGVEKAIGRCFSQGEPFTLEYRIRRADTGEERWLQSHGNRIAAHGGDPARFVGISFDITARKRADQHQMLLINELNHRVKNTLAIVQAVAQQTFAGEGMAAGARRAFEGRLAALSAAHNLLTDQNWEGATIRQVIEGGMAAYRSGDRVRISGPNLPLAPKTAVSLAMAVHELATNATKYGSLSSGEGKVEIDWSAKGGKLDLIWRESGGPPVARPARRGFGSRMIERGLAAELSGTVALDFAPAGLVCTVSAPLPAREAA